VAPPSSTPVEGRMCSGTYADARITSTGVWVYQPEANFHFRGTRLFQIGGPSIRFATTDVIQISTYTCSLHSLNKLLQFQNILLYSEFLRYEEQKQSQ